MNEIKNIIVIGASAGGMRALTELIGQLPHGHKYAVFVVLHLAKQSDASIIAYHFQKTATFECRVPSDNEMISPGRVYIAPSDRHMLLKDGHIRITQGPAENRWRPSIDVLFRSAAANYNSKVIGIVLTGLLDDGTSGMSAIKRSGGITMVQEPAEAEFPDMPGSVINNVQVDYRVPIADMKYVLEDLFSKPMAENKKIPDEVKIEADMTERMASSIDELSKIGSQTILTCPECGGGLWQIKNDNIPRYRCHTGHVFSENVLLQEQAESLEGTLWVAIRMMEERRNLLKMAAEHERKNGKSNEEPESDKKAEEMQNHIDKLKAVLISMKKKDIH